jgi:hypothetical protein
MHNRSSALFAPDGGAASGGGATDNAATGGAAPAAFDWGASLGAQAATLQPLVATKGWKSPADALTAYQNLESLVGRAVVPPGADAKSEDWAPVFDKLGRPQAPDGYSGIARPAELPADFLPDDDLTGFRQAAHKAGLNDIQAKELFGWFAGRGQSQFVSARDADAKVEPELRTKWGGSYDANVEIARRAAKSFGGDGVLDVLEKKVGGVALVEFFHRVGVAMGEDTLAGGGGPAGGAKPATPQAAQQKIAQLSSDPAFQKRLFNQGEIGHADAKREWQDLHKVAYT